MTRPDTQQDMLADDPADSADAFARMGRAIAWLEEHYTEQPTLEEAAEAAGLSPWHFQRLFTRWAGVSPRRFVAYLTLDHAKQHLDRSASVMDAAFDAGLSGPSRLHDLFVTLDAMTPGEFKRGGEGLAVRFGYAPTPFGEAIVCWTERGICGMGFTLEMGREGARADMAARWPHARMTRDDEGAAARVAEIFGNRSGAPLRLHVMGTNFQVRVWEALLRIPPGAVTTYARIAQHLGDAKAVRAVGTAVGRNPVSYLIPCHRVLRGTGALAGYHWGLKTKRALLAMEAARAEERAEAGAA